MRQDAPDAAAFEVQDGARCRIVGNLEFATVTRLLPIGTEAIDEGKAAVVDLGGVTASDSSGLALLIEWLSVAQHTKRALRYENMPSQLHQLARLSEVEELLSAPEAAPTART